MAIDRELIIVGGANGTGKTTFAREFVAERSVAYLGADAIAAELAPDNPASVQIQAGRRFAALVEEHLQRGNTFIVESTLSGVMFKRWIEQARLHGYRILIYYVFVDSPETCIERVAHRVRMGGHDVPEVDIRRRFARSLRNFWYVYRELADKWVVMYNAPGEQVDVATGSREHSAIRDQDRFAKFRSLLGI